MSLQIVKFRKLKWINIVNPDGSDMAYLGKNFNFHTLDLEDVFEDSQRPKMDAYKYYVFLILHFPEWDNKMRLVANQISIFIEDNWLITIQKNKLKSLEECFKKCGKSSKMKRDFMSGSSGFLLYKMLVYLFDTCLPAVDALGRDIGAIEEQIFDEETEAALKNLALMKRNVLTFRRMIDPQRFVIDALAHTEKSFLPKNLGVYFDDIHDFIEKIWAMLDNYMEMAEWLHTTNETLISHKTNAVIKVLTVISVCLLPLTLFSGIYGMNIVGLPFAQRPGFVWLMMGGMGLVIFLAIAYFRKKNWL